VSDDDRYDLERFVEAQRRIYACALAEIRGGLKRSHWMWFVFPQLAGLGHSSMSQRYAVHGLAEARSYLAHPVLGARLTECADALLALSGRSAHEIFGNPDELKLRSSMTLFAAAAGPDSVFARVLQRYFGGEPDPRTLELLGSPEP
jgi:uncharacterized protein (DUF1810 family)